MTERNKGHSVEGRDRERPLEEGKKELSGNPIAQDKFSDEYDVNSFHYPSNSNNSVILFL